MGLFKPAWMSYNFKKGFRATEKEKNQSKLYKIAKNATFQEVRLLAATKLTDQTLAQDIYVDAAMLTCGDKKMYNFAINNITDQNKLVDLIKNHDDKNVCQRAIFRITDQNLLAFLAIAECRNGGNNQRPVVIDQITDQTLLAQLAKYAPPDNKYDERKHVPYIAVRKLTDQDLLADVAKNAPDRRARLDAAEKLTDQTLAQEIYADVAKNDTDWHTRKAAAEKLTDQALAQETYADVAKNHTDSDVRIDASKKLTEQAVLADLAKNDTDYKVREAADKRLNALRGGTVQDESL